MNAIAPYRPPGGSKLVRFANDGVAADVRMGGVDRRAGTMWYEIRLASVRTVVSGRLIGVERDGTAVELGTLDVSAGSMSSSRIAVPLPAPNRPYTQFFLEIASDGMMLHVAAPPPPYEPKRRLSALRVGVALVALGLTAAGGGVFASTLPDAPTIAAPSHAFAGDLVHLPYATRGMGNARYVASIENGAVIASGDLPSKRGEIALALPPSSAHKNVTVAVSVAGVLGTVSKSASFAVAAPEPLKFANAARVAALTVHRDATGGGDSILASYLAVADEGELLVTDHENNVVGRAPFQHRGTERIAIPGQFHDKPLDVRLNVRRGQTRATAMVEVQPVVDPAAVAAAAAANAVPADASRADAQNTAAANTDAPPTISPDEIPEAVVPADDKTTTTTGDEPFAIAGTPVAGEPLRILIKRYVSGMHLRLQDDAGLAIDEADVPSTSRTISLRTPAISAARTYYLTCSYGSGSGEEVLVRSVRVAAR
ncbi:hypothetical protein WPS_22980 [Vulcanimicrobium alpinum]|uniref:Uncharacterized protein n=1 Tax=Vulcanimicrobium alpinum TaxID=3016050 RepID=A0AAN1XX68_UNVUL|nr:hypothetical protein [Vulcanimicrobium alpinum]BDE07022.1 hypothetical protein WPS_22980 [Vulcanimicrobium alpinum]